MTFRQFPCWWVENGRCACPRGGEPEHRSPGKHPLTPNGVKDATDDPEQLRAWRERWPKANWAIATGDGLTVIDLDIKPGKNGVESLKRLGQVPHTRTVRTGGGGLHLYFLGGAANSSGKLGPGIDVRGDGGYVMAPGSGHQSDRPYELLRDVEPAPLPAWLAKRLTEPHAPTGAGVKTDRGYFLPASTEVLQAARDALVQHGPAVEGEGGDTHTMAAAALLTHDFALTDDEAWPLLQEWNETCEPPWTDDDLREKLANGQKYGKRPYGCRRAMDSQATATKMIADWDRNEATAPALAAKIRQLPFNDPAVRGFIEQELMRETGLKARDIALPKVRPPRENPYGFALSEDGRPIQNLDNVVRLLEHKKSKLHFDTFKQKVVSEDGSEWTDAHTLAMTLKIQREVGLPGMSSKTVGEAVYTYAHRNEKNCLTEWLRKLKWDGVPRLEEFAVKAFGTKDNEYTRAVGANFLKCLVVRAEQPGSKVDTMVILEGPQGIHKSTAVAKLTAPWFAEASTAPDSKDFYQCLQGAWGVEIPEMGAFNKAEVNVIKRALSCRNDRFRAPYGHVPQDWPRQCVFVGTTNDDSYLRDPTGGRRFWPLRCGRIDLAYIEATRELLFAEALTRTNAGEPWWQMPGDATAAEQESRTLADPWETLLAEHVAGKAEVEVEDLLVCAVGLSLHQVGRAEQLRVSAILQRLGFSKADVRREGVKRRVWMRDE